MKKQKLKIGIADVAEAKGISYRKCLRHMHDGAFFLDNERPGESLLSISVYVCDSNAYRRLIEVMDENVSGENGR